jgi:hypothetical protein
MELANTLTHYATATITAARSFISLPMIISTSEEYKVTGSEPKSCLDQISKFKLSCFCYECNGMAYLSTHLGCKIKRYRIAIYDKSTDFILSYCRILSFTNTPALTNTLAYYRI